MSRKSHVARWICLAIILAAFVVPAWRYVCLQVEKCGTQVDKARSDNYYYGFFARDRIYYIPMGNGFELGCTELVGVDISSFKVLGACYTKDEANYSRDAATPRIGSMSIIALRLCPKPIPPLFA